MPTLVEVMPSSVVMALGLVLLTVAVADDPPRRRGGLGAWVCCGLAFAFGALAVGGLVVLGHPLAAVAAAGVSLAGGAGLIALMRARPRDDEGEDGGGGGGYEPPAPPGDPGGIFVDWDEFERELSAYIEDRELVRG